MFQKFINMLERFETATDFTVLEKDPLSARTTKIRSKHLGEKTEFEVGAAIERDKNKQFELMDMTMKIAREEGDQFSTIYEAGKEAQRRIEHVNIP